MLLDLYPYRASAHSGMVRLQLYKMQEEHLLKREAQRVAEQVVKQETEKNEQVEGQATPKRARKAAPRKFALVEREEFPEVQFRRKPIFTRPMPVNTDIPIWLSFVSLEVQSWFTTFIPLWKEQNRAIIVFNQNKQSAANDADIRLRLLLLAA